MISYGGLIHSFLVISDAKHLFMYLLSICRPSLEKMSVQVLCLFLVQLFGGFAKTEIAGLHPRASVSEGLEWSLENLFSNELVPG